MAEAWMTQGDAAKALKKSRKTVNRWVANGAPHRRADGAVKLGRLTEWAAERGLLRDGPGRPLGSINGAPAVPSEAKARQRQKAAKADPEAAPPEPATSDRVADARQKMRDLEDAKLREARAKAALRELELEQKRGGLVSAEEVRAERAARIVAAKGLLDALPGRLAGRLAHKSPREVRLGLEEVVREVCATFAGEPAGEQAA